MTAHATTHMTTRIDGQRSPVRVNSRNGYRQRPWDTRAGTIDPAIQRLRSGSAFPEWLPSVTRVRPTVTACQYCSKARSKHPSRKARSARVPLSALLAMRRFSLPRQREAGQAARHGCGDRVVLRVSSPCLVADCGPVRIS